MRGARLRPQHVLEIAAGSGIATRELVGDETTARLGAGPVEAETTALVVEARRR